MAWASRLISTRDVLRNWLLVYLGNVLGCLGTVLFVVWADIASLGGGAVGETAIQIARAKAGLSLGEAFARGVLCNALVCLAVWLAMGGRSVTDKILAILFPITAFVALGFEHSIANWFFLPFGLALDRKARCRSRGSREPRRGDRGQHRRRDPAGRGGLLGRLPARRAQRKGPPS